MSTKEKHFQYLVEKGNPVGEVIAVERYLVRLSGMNPITMHALVMFEDGSKGFVREVGENFVSVLHLGTKLLRVGVAAVLQHESLVTKVGEGFIGRVVSVTGDPLDGKGPIAADTAWPVFNDAPPLIGRRELDDQLETGITLIDAVFPLVLGQRVAVLGDSKSGKSTLLTQLALNQKDSDRFVVYVLIAKRPSDVNDLLIKLEKNDAMKNAIVVVSTMFDSLAMSYLAPYVACAMAEYLWQQKDMDGIIIYDDLTNHAHVYREISLLAGVSPSRDSYPGDMFYAHSTLLERAGRLDYNGKTLTSLPIVHVPNGDFTTYLPTNVMSITDGQLILDMSIFRDGIRPAVSTGLSVSRVGGRGHNSRQKEIAGRIVLQLAKYQQAQEFSHFGSELALEARNDLEMGKNIREIFTQTPGEYYSLMAQQLIFDSVLTSPPGTVFDIPVLKKNAAELAPQVTDEESFAKIKEQLLKGSLIEMKGGAEAEDAPTPDANDEASSNADESPGDEKKDEEVDANDADNEEKHDEVSATENTEEQENSEENDEAKE